MFRKTVRATGQTNVDAAVAELRGDASRAGVPDLTIDSMVRQARLFLDPLVRQGANMSRPGRRLSSRQNIEGPGYAVTIEFQLGERQSQIRRIARLFRKLDPRAVAAARRGRRT